MGRRIITTVGLSALTNCGWRPGSDLPLLASLIPRLKADPRRASAELNVLDRLELGKDDAVVLVRTNTDEGRLASEALRAYLASKGVEVVCRQIDSLTGDAKAMRGKGLVELAKTIVEEAEQKGWEPVVNANGGYKVQTHMAMTIAATLGIKAYYIHDSQVELVSVPRLPIAWDRAFFLAVEPALEVLANAGAQWEFEAAVAILPPEYQERVRELAVYEDDLALMSPLVYSGYRSYQKDHNEAALRPVLLSKRAAKDLAGAGSVAAKLNRLIGRAADPNSSSWAETKSNAPGLLFLPKGPVNEHVAFYENQDEQGSPMIVIARAWTIHSEYEADIDSLTLMPSNFPGAVPWTPGA